MELYIETLTGTAFELKVSPFESIASVKSKIQRLEGIPIQQQHLIWNSVELDDDYCLQDYRINDGATLKLVLAMRGGPINTRRSEYFTPHHSASKVKSSVSPSPNFSSIFVLEIFEKYLACTWHPGFIIGPPILCPTGRRVSFNLWNMTPQYIADNTGYELECLHTVFFPVPMEDPTLREMAEYMEANRDEILDKIPSSKQVTLLVFREGDQLNFFRVVDKGDGTLSPLSESLSGASVYNLGYDDEEDDDGPTKEQVEENEKTKDKMKLIRNRMETMSISKKPKKKPFVVRPPSSGRPSSKSRYRRIPSANKSKNPSGTINKNVCLPPVGQTKSIEKETENYGNNRLMSRNSPLGGATSSSEKTTVTPRYITARCTPITNYKLPTPPSVSKEVPEPLESAKLKRPLTSVLEDANIGTSVITSKSEPAVDIQGETSSSKSAEKRDSAESLLQKAQISASRMKENLPEGHRKKDITLESLKESLALKPPSTIKKSNSTESPVLAPNNKKEITLDGIKDTIGRPPTSSKYANPETRLERDRKQGLFLESLSQSEARAMSGLLRQASLERLGSSKLSNFVRSASRSRAGFNLGNMNDIGRIPTPEGRLMSARLQRLSASRDGRVMSPSHRLPPVKQKKKAGKRCFVCAKKTGLATSYQCRCGNNFCATHRYAESHSCTFDYKTEGRKLLEQSNPVVNAPKLPKI